MVVRLDDDQVSASDSEGMPEDLLVGQEGEGGFAGRSLPGAHGLLGAGGRHRVLISLVADQAVSATVPATQEAGVIIGLTEDRPQACGRLFAGGGLLPHVGDGFQPVPALLVEVGVC